MKGVELLKLNRRFDDARGYFIEVYKQDEWPSMVQSNCSFSSPNVVRGLHYQKGENAQGKIVQVVSGRIVDVILDIRPGSDTFGQVVTYELTPGSGVVTIDPLLAHGFWALEPSVVLYHCTKKYAPSFEGSINPLSEGLSLPWLHLADSLIISDKDRAATKWRDYETSLLVNPDSIN